VSRPLRVAVVGGSGKATGVESHLLALLASFDRAEVDPVLFTPVRDPMVDELRARGIAVELGAPTRKLDFKAGRELARRWAGRFDVVHAHGPRHSFWALRAARRARVPAFVVTMHELRWQNLPPGPRRWLWIRLEADVMRRADHLITVSEAARRALIGKFPEITDRISVVHASAPLLLEADRLPRADPGRREHGVFRIVTVGRFYREKGYDLLLPALARLKQAGVRFSVDVLGFGILEQEVRSLAQGLGLDGLIQWHAPTVRPREVLPTGHAFVTATRGETFGIAVLEAMAFGLPVLAPAVGGLTELVAEGESGSLVAPAPENALPERLASILARWASSPEETRRLGEAAARRARDEFGPARFARGVAEVYRQVLERTRR
jgi:glycosyltransferase involved in cell wall biosynthesis